MHHQLSDTQIRAVGELRHQRDYAHAPVRPVELDALEHEINHVRGVVRVHFDFHNWTRLESGEWQLIEEDGPNGQRRLWPDWRQRAAPQQGEAVGIEDEDDA